jgi:hypothetical protein
VALGALVACGSGDSGKPAVEMVACPSCSGSVPFLPLSAGPLANLTLTEVAAFQVLKAPLMKDGQAVPRDDQSIPIASGRTTLLRLYVRPEAGWAPKPVGAAVRLATETPTGTIARTVTAPPVTISGPSDEGDLATTINVEIPEGLLAPDTSFSVTLTDASVKGSAPATSPARWPADGSLVPMGNSNRVPRLRVLLVPVAYGADGSNRLPDLSDEQLERYRKQLYKLYPVASVEITVREEAFPWSMPISPGGSGYGQLLQAIQQLRAMEQPEGDVYYYGAFAPTTSFGSFCGGGCVTGLSFVGVPASIGVGFAGGGSASTMAHEVGHAHTLEHAPCGGAGGPDKNFPYADGGIGVWGYDGIEKILIDPEGPPPRPKPKDLMGYCNPDWISDYHLGKLWLRVQSDSMLVAQDWSAGAEPQPTLVVDGAGTLSRGGAARGAWIAGGEPRDVVLERASGRAQAVARFFPYDHLPGGMLVLPRGVDPTVLRVHVPSFGPRATLALAPGALAAP